MPLLRIRSDSLKQKVSDVTRQRRAFAQEALA
jgi:hypothetical protein